MRRALFLALLVISAGPATGQSVYHTFPDWESSDTPATTGGALADLNGDGWLDFVVANGNDVGRQRVAVYHNRGDGTFPPTPTWQSGDTVYNGHLDVGDLNGDGWPDVAVAGLGTTNFSEKLARVYMNNVGTLSSQPDWQTSFSGSAFGVAFGDMNNDGRPDLAIATGYPHGWITKIKNMVYLNVNGALEAMPSWQADDAGYSGSVAWVDCDGDGWLDLISAATDEPTQVYRNLGGMLETTASWRVGDAPGSTVIMVTAGDVTGDGLDDLLLADNTWSTHGGSGMFRQYDGKPSGMFQTAASWTSFFEDYCAVVRLADVDSDGDLDLATGAWWDPARIFLNTGTGFENPESWRSARSTVVEEISFGDIDKNGLRPVETLFDEPAAGQRLFQLPYRPVQRILAVEVDGQPLGHDQYVVQHELGWFTIGVDPVAHVRVRYTVSSKLDMAVTNWDSVGNQLYYNQLIVKGDANCDGKLDFGDINPFVALLTGGYHQLFPECDGETFCDMNEDGKIDFLDINPFVAALTNPL